MDLPAYLYSLLVEGTRLYWPALAYNVLVYFLWLWNFKTDIPVDFRKNIFGARVIGDSRGFIGFQLALVVGILGAFLTASYLPLLSCVGANFGTICESFVKRRLGIPRGRHLWVIDEIDTLLGATLFLLPAVSIPLDVFLFSIAVTFIAHYALNSMLRPMIEKSVSLS